MTRSRFAGHFHRVCIEFSCYMGVRISSGVSSGRVNDVHSNKRRGMNGRKKKNAKEGEGNKVDQEQKRGKNKETKRKTRK